MGAAQPESDLRLGARFGPSLQEAIGQLHSLIRPVVETQPLHLMRVLSGIRNGCVWPGKEEGNWLASALCDQFQDARRWARAADLDLMDGLSRDVGPGHLGECQSRVQSGLAQGSRPQLDSTLAATLTDIS